MAEKLTKVHFTNLEKVLYPDLKITKAQIIEYYIRMAPKMLGVLAKRPIVMTRFPNGIDEEGFYEKDAPQGAPQWVETHGVYSNTATREINYIIVGNLDTIVWLANLAALEIHMTLSQADSFENPDLAVFDLDPKPPAGFDKVIEVALRLKEELDNLGLKSYVKTSGKKGLHILLPIIGDYTFKHTREFVRKIGNKLKKQNMAVATERVEADIPGKVHIDYVQNSHGRTMICPYSLRATARATVSMPLDWSRVKKGLNPEDFNLFSVTHVARSPWEDMMENKQKLQEIQNG